jgi:hypothetical protein
VRAGYAARRAASGRCFAKWFYPFHLTVEFDEGHPPDDAALSRRLRPYDNLYTGRLPHDRLPRAHGSGLRAMEEGGNWEFMHPWIECILPWDTAADCIEQMLSDTPPGIQVGGHVLHLAREGDDSAPRTSWSPRREPGRASACFQRSRRNFWGEMSERLENVSRMMIMFGAKRYLSGG